MAEHEYKMTCPACSGTLTADDEATLLKKVHEHAHDHHGMDLTDEKIREMIAGQKA
jgi:predicted small metal-binding protein